MSPFQATGPLVTVKVALTLEPAGTELNNDVPRRILHRGGTARLSSTPATAAPVVFVNVTVVSCDELGENVWSPLLEIVGRTELGSAAAAD
jgi:hypothetical protein